MLVPPLVTCALQFDELSLPCVVSLKDNCIHSSTSLASLAICLCADGENWASSSDSTVGGHVEVSYTNCGGCN
ncbi:hypothetical protein L1987_52486 [Smallanthus sonchifolius]|uniref:Uncharacterized protein n=1 Tax=Smallanthus sonchifolius TaxID=185202 RepID=A0ACB9EU06_9ASTR|nr:hypothetical protein L1987_52486 [Smallanthus sonchifolius]